MFDNLALFEYGRKYVKDIVIAFVGGAITGGSFVLYHGIKYQIKKSKKGIKGQYNKWD